jgi:putative membrane protein
MVWYGPQLSGWGWALGLSSLVFWVLLVVAVIALVRLFTGGGQRLLPPYRGAPYTESGPAAAAAAAAPEQILAGRFARGEIDEDEFHQRMAALRAEAAHPGSAATPS